MAKIRLWYQSMSREKAWSAYNEALRRILNRIKDPDTEIEVHGITRIGGTADQFHYLDYLETGEVLENVQTAVRRGFDGFLIGNIGDPGIRAAREIADIPVLGLCESALHMACMMGNNFSLVTINEKFTPRILDNVERYGFRPKLAAVNRMKVDRILNLDSGFTDARARKNIVGQFLKAADANVEQGAEVVIAAGGVLMALLAEAGVHRASRQTPVLNGITALVKTAEAVVKMDRIMDGGWVSKRLYYAPPPPEQIAEIRKYYGDVYPTVKAPRKRRGTTAAR